MRLPFSSRRRKPAFPTAKIKSLSLRTSVALPDILSTSLLALKESADAFPPLKSAVGGVLAVWDIADRAKQAKSDACDIALRAEKILDVITDAVPNPSNIPPPMLQRIKRFTVLLEEIRYPMEAIAFTSSISRIVHLRRNERALQGIKAELDEAYHDFLAASALRVETQQAGIADRQAAQQTLLASQQTETHIAVGNVAVAIATSALRVEAQQAEIAVQQTVQHMELASQQGHTYTALGKVAATTDALVLDLSSVLFYSRLSVFFGQPLNDLLVLPYSYIPTFSPCADVRHIMCMIC
ncbi:hypothetical protein B0H16DRAFT_1687847 [Mycena metata]|uniref:Uncharacterized protein n=1 Tax=Mycena metata TaxID=1033252 RepID=A0AAD7NJR9_9AGAR|nr:hypothetical protein B0H16DRAFT_1687847 [Mycena metata]